MRHLFSAINAPLFLVLEKRGRIYRRVQIWRARARRLARGSQRVDGFDVSTRTDRWRERCVWQVSPAGRATRSRRIHGPSSNVVSATSCLSAQ